MPATHTDPLGRYWAKRDFSKTPEPRGVRAKAGKALSFVVQKHDATRLHYDFRLELDGVLLSWAVPKGPSYDPADKRMAVRTEDHPMSYADFEGTIPPGQYGAGHVIVWDRGTWTPHGDPRASLAAGKLSFELQGEKLEGVWELVRLKRPDESKETWLLFKKRDEHARPHADYDVVIAKPDSVMTSKPPASTARKKAPKRAPLPETMSPQLATLATGVPSSGTWSYELKYDGYRVMTRFERGVPKLVTRGGHDWTARLPELSAALRELGVKSGWLDGELVVLNDNGVPDFNALQNAFDRQRTGRIVYFLFDAPFLEGRDLREEPLSARRAALKAVLDERGTDRVRFSPDIDADPHSILASACAMKLEGVIAKRTDAPYESRRSTSWLKLKCQQRQEFVIVGFTARKNVDGEIGSLLLAVHDASGTLKPVGSVGTGWDTDTSRALWKELTAIEASKAPFESGGPAKRSRWSRRPGAVDRWVKPTRIAEVNFGEWTPDQQIRHAVFISLRTDKPVHQITREKAVDAPAIVKSSVKVSNPERVIDPSTGTTKLDLVRFYEAIAPHLLPHLKGRPVSLVRGPEGVGGELFFQKHLGKVHIDGIKELPVSRWEGHEPLMEVNTAKALAASAQMNTVEFHTWNTMSRHIGKPDRIVFDVDPGEGVGWAMVQEAAILTRALLTELGLVSWLKTSGGKGLHVVVPIAPRLDWDTVKAFSRDVVAHMAHHIPERFVVKSGPANRVGKIFIDYLRNGHGATTAAAFSARARPGLGVSMPISWDELPDVKSGSQWTVANTLDHLSFRKVDPWADYAGTKQALAAAIRKLEKAQRAV
ncbi:DNA ligase D [Piscinibacter gummiphilus]|uniref:DNA ligase (ATP) n=1 Tax=Piscinibacter gummiphilus TaxID=946333 RepID=A0A1W6L4B4_9BURK|nr:DNA ligase D [Piscinibacter gummiphilus]ARN19135.1 ATP-dependent DNA ligase [Piscinibacter gummiphilus]ATU63789.1 DNA ligase D [Piscinibacter gummiphilus]GLS93272.1 multifunctional non-homologous end joining protein LigD [Piscinibacter gummiphilus]